MRRATLLLLLLMAAAPAPARAHVVYGRKSLSILLAEADLVVRARITTPRLRLGPAGAGLEREGVEAEVLEALKGRTGDPAPTLRFATHAHGAPAYRPGERVVLCLQDVARSRELDELRGSLAWVSLQEHDDALRLDTASGPLLLRAVRAYLRAPTLAPPERTALLRRTTVALLASRDPRLAASALSDLVTGPAALSADDLPALERVLADAGTAIGVRAGLLAELERRGLVHGPERWAALLADARPAELGVAIRAAGAHPSAPVFDRLVALLASPDPEIAAEAAVALGRPGDTQAVPPLTGALARPEARVRFAAVRALAWVGDDAARGALEEAAGGHPDPETRRRAAAALRMPRAAP